MTETLDQRLARTRRPATTEWLACPACRRPLYGRRYVRELHVCPECGHHRRIGATERLAQLFDPDTEVPLAPCAAVVDPLGFTDEQPYPRRLAAARAATGLSAGVAAARGTIEGQPVVAAAMDFGFIGGSLGAAEGEQIVAAAGYARDHRTPLLVVTASGGARMQEGALALMQMARTSAAFAELDEAGVLTIALICDPTYGGVAASFATLADVLIAEQGARLGFAGPRVIEQTLRERLPAGFQSAARLAEQGLLDLVRPRAALRATLGQLLRAAAAPPSGSPPRDVPSVLIRDPARLPERDPWEVVQRSRDRRRPTTVEYAAQILDGFYELHGDRLAADCPAIVGGLGRLAGSPVMLIGHQKGHTTRELAARNFAMASPAGYRKAARLLRLAAKLGLPVVTLIDTPGAAAGVAAEEQGQAYAIAENLRLLSGLPVPVVAVVTGEGGSGGALALAVADRVLALPDSTYSVISPEGCAAILWREPAAAAQAARELRLTASDLLRLEIIDGVVPEPEGGGSSDPTAAAALLGEALRESLAELAGVPAETLVRRRRERFGKYGRALPAPASIKDEEVTGDGAARA